MKKTLFLILLVVGFSIASPPQSAADSSAGESAASRPATKKDLLGTWEVVSVRPQINSQDPAFYPYQRYVFNANSTMKFMTANTPFTKEWLEQFRRQPAEIDFTVGEKGLLHLMWQKKPHQEKAISAYVLKEIPADVLAKIPQDKRKGLPKKGDISLSFVDAQGKIALQKVLKRVG